MTFKEKSKKKTDGQSMIAAEVCSFSDVVDKACYELMDRQIKYSIRRIQEMDDCLFQLEQELDEFLKLRNSEQRTMNNEQ